MEWNVEVGGNSWMIEYFVCAEPDEGADCVLPRIFRLHITKIYEVESTVATADAATAGNAEASLGVHNGTSGLSLSDISMVVQSSPSSKVYRTLNLNTDFFNAYFPISTDESFALPTPEFGYTARSDELTVLFNFGKWTFASATSVLVLAGHVEYLVDGVATAYTADEGNGTLIASDLVAERTRVGLDIATTDAGYDMGAEVVFDDATVLIRLPKVQEDAKRSIGGDLRLTVKTHVDCTGRECGGVCGKCASSDFCGDNGECHAKRLAGRKNGGCACTGSLSGYKCCQLNSCGTGCYQSITSVGGVPSGKTCCSGSSTCGCEEYYSLTYCGDGVCDDSYETQESCPDDCGSPTDDGEGEGEGDGEGENVGEGAGEGEDGGFGLDDLCKADCAICMAAECDSCDQCNDDDDAGAGVLESSTAASSTLTLFGMRLK